MSGLRSAAQREDLARIVRRINPALAPQYGARLDEWVRLAACAPGMGCQRVLVDILKQVNPPVADLYGPMLDSWASRPANCYALAAILKMVNPPLAPSYGKLLDDWARRNAPPAETALGLQ
ncbi:MAG: hypothetical protein KF889_26755 [Alphaproteobacteria bacterium]|nr:hypothetical protein [Alphaproteobacteria bacterium]MCW5738592.1 hypothetical protein [Alphaproteobacteria bacterium]